MMASANTQTPAGTAEEIITALAQQAPTTVYEAAGKKGAMNATLRPVAPGMRLCGRALTVRCQPADNLTLHAAVTKAKPGDVIVADVGGFIEAGHWGEVLTVAAQQRGILGLVINGGVRDIDAARRRNFPVFAGGVSMKATVKEVFGSINEPIVCGGVEVRPGDIVLGDDDGVVVVAIEDAGPALQGAIAREAAELEVMRRLQAGELTIDILGFRDKIPQTGGTNS